MEFMFLFFFLDIIYFREILGNYIIGSGNFIWVVVLGELWEIYYYGNG